MLEQQSHNVSKLEELPSQPRWDHSAKKNNLLDLLGEDNVRIQPVTLTLSSVVNANIYARRHSTNSYPNSKDYFCPSIAHLKGTLQPPAVPKRTHVPLQSQTQQQAQIKPQSQFYDGQNENEKYTKQSNYPLGGGQRSRGTPPAPPPRSPASLLSSKLSTSKSQLETNRNRSMINQDCVFQFDNNFLHEFGKIPPAPMGPPPPAPKPYHKPAVSPGTKTSIPQQQGNPQRASVRQDSSVSSDSFSQTSSPSYTTKTMETPLLPRRTSAKPSSVSKQNQAVADDGNGNSALTKSVSTPASLQTIVRFHNGSNMSLHHRIIRDMRRSSSHNYVRRVRIKFRFAQVVMNAVALLAIGGGMAVYFKAQPSPMRVVNATFNATTPVRISDNSALNPAPGICLPVIVNFCQQHKVPYNFTVFPNYMGHFGQPDAQHELEVYDAVVDVRCYELAALFLCSVFVPKCGPGGIVVRPCLSLCSEMKRRCGFFLDVFGLALPDYLECGLFPESSNPEVCVGHHEVKEAKNRAQRPVCQEGFQCDGTRCIPKDWRCDGHLDCKDKTDEIDCYKCPPKTIHCGNDKCVSPNEMCDGKVDCPMAQDERSCLRLSDRNGDLGLGKLEVYRPDIRAWRPACITRWDTTSSPEQICYLLGYSNTDGSYISGIKDPSHSPIVQETTEIWRMHQNRLPKNMLREFTSCSGSSYPTVNISCSNYMCGKARKSYAERRSLRIVGGNKAKPGDWPFLAALLGGPEEIFYCAGVLIADQWVLTASHCVGNHSDVSGWTIQLGITRRHAHAYYGQKMKVKRVVPHPLYNVGTAHDNDIALFQLSSHVNFHEHLLPVCLPRSYTELKPGTVCTVIGWGKKEDTGMSEYEPEINEVDVPVLNRDLCNTWLENRDLNVTEGMICAGYKEGGKDACQGDSGGPLLCRDKQDSERWFVGGIVSWGIKCAHPHLPGVYAYVPKYVPWINQQIQQYSN